MYLYTWRETFGKPVSLSLREGLETNFFNLSNFLQKCFTSWLYCPWLLADDDWTNCLFPLGYSGSCRLPPSATTYPVFRVNSMLTFSMSRHISPEYLLLFNLTHLIYSPTLPTQNCFFSMFTKAYNLLPDYTVINMDYLGLKFCFHNKTVNSASDTSLSLEILGIQ